MSEDHERFAFPLVVGMNTAAEVARQAGYFQAAEAISKYAKDWQCKADKSKRPLVRAMERADIFPPEAERYATAADFGLSA